MGEDAYENYNDFIKYNENVGYYIPIYNIYFYKEFFKFLLPDFTELSGPLGYPVSVENTKKIF